MVISRVKSIVFSKKRLLVWLFCFLISLIVWVLSSSLNLSRQFDYDPYRYLFLAVQGYDISELGENFRVVEYLSFIGQNPFGIYAAHIVIVLAIVCLLSLQISATFKLYYYIPVALLTNLYLVQTGKDGFLAAALLCLLTNNHCHSRLFKPKITTLLSPINICLFVLILFVIWIRVQSVLYIGIGFLLARRKYKAAIVLSLLASLLFYVLGSYLNINLDDSLKQSFYNESNIQSVVGGVDISQLTPISFVVRLFIYLVSIFAVPLVYIMRFIADPSRGPYLAFLGTLILWSALIMAKSRKSLSVFFLNICPFCIFLAASPAVHFRYLFLAIPFCLTNSVREFQISSDRLPSSSQL